MKIYVILFCFSLLFVACQPAEPRELDISPLDLYDWTQDTESEMSENLQKYIPFKLQTDISALSENEKKMIPLLIEAGKIMDELFWFDAYGDQEELLTSLSSDEEKAFCLINYGPWDRLNNNQPFIDGVGPKPAGANFYPRDMTKEEFEQSDLPNKAGLYHYLRRNVEGELYTLAYHETFPDQVQKVADLLSEAAELAEDEGLQEYLELRAEAILTDDYKASDIAWLDMKSNRIDVVIGPIETYEDQLFGYKSSHTCYVLVKDMEWSERLSRFAQFLPELQKNLPVPHAYKQEEPGTDTELNAYDVVYYAGDCNAGSKTIAINLPNDEEVQLTKGTRRLQLKNAMKAKFDKILIPISEVLIDESQRSHITFDAFFANTMFHEVAHGLGIKNTINGSSTVRKALKEHASALEEGKADMLGLFMIRQLHNQGEIDGNIRDYYVTFMASIFRSVRFGASSAHGKANMIRFNYFDEMGAFSRHPETGTYQIQFDKFEAAMDSLARLILTLQGDGDYESVDKLVQEKALIRDQLQEDLNRLAEAGIPVDIVFDQGIEVLGLEELTNS